jgi:rhodanese-related sulfurtransferase/DNA-binding transcriptional ArsR family regulator
MTERRAKRALFDAFAVIGKAVSSGRRIEILDILANGDRSVEALSVQLELSVANTSQHLQVLRRAGLVSSQRAGTSVIYSLATAEVFDFVRALREVAAARVTGIGDLATAYLGRNDPEPSISRQELSELIASGVEPLVLDIRPREEYLAGHIPEATSVPLEELPTAVRHLPKDREVIAYCRGPYCVYSRAAVALLRRRGFRARRLEDGLPEWGAEGRAIARGP